MFRPEAARVLKSSSAKFSRTLRTLSGSSKSLEASLFWPSITEGLAAPTREALSSKTSLTSLSPRRIAPLATPLLRSSTICAAAAFLWPDRFSRKRSLAFRGISRASTEAIASSFERRARSDGGIDTSPIPSRWNPPTVSAAWVASSEAIASSARANASSSPRSNFFWKCPCKAVRFSWARRKPSSRPAPDEASSRMSVTNSAAPSRKPSSSRSRWFSILRGSVVRNSRAPREAPPWNVNSFCKSPWTRSCSATNSLAAPSTPLRKASWSPLRRSVSSGLPPVTPWAARPARRSSPSARRPRTFWRKVSRA